MFLCILKKSWCYIHTPLPATVIRRACKRAHACWHTRQCKEKKNCHDGVGRETQGVLGGDLRHLACIVQLLDSQFGPFKNIPVDFKNLKSSVWPDTDWECTGSLGATYARCDTRRAQRASPTHAVRAQPRFQPILHTGRSPRRVFNNVKDVCIKKIQKLLFSAEKK